MHEYTKFQLASHSTEYTKFDLSAVLHSHIIDDYDCILGFVLEYLSLVLVSKPLRQISLNKEFFFCEFQLSLNQQIAHL